MARTQRFDFLTFASLDFCSLKGKAGSAVAYQAARPDAGVSRTFLWWAWKGGAPELQAQLTAPPAAKWTGFSACLKAAAAAASACGVRRSNAETDMEKDNKPAAKAAAPKRPPVPVLDGLTATLLDEAMLRGEPLLAPYWAGRHSLQGGCGAYVTGNQQLLEVHCMAELCCRSSRHMFGAPLDIW